MENFLNFNLILLYKGQTEQSSPSDWPRSTFPPRTHSFVSLHDLPGGGIDHWRTEELTDVTTVGQRGCIGHEPGSPVLYVENTSHAVFTLIISANSKQISPVTCLTSLLSYLSSNSEVPLSEGPSSTRVRLDNLEY